MDVHKGVRWGEGVLAFLKNVAASLTPMTGRVNVMKGGGLGNQHTQCSEAEGQAEPSDIRSYRIPFLEFQADRGTHRLEAELEQQPQTRREPDASAQRQPDQQGDVSAELSRIPGISEALCQLSSLVTNLEGMAKKLDTSLLKVHILGCLPKPGSLPK